MMHLVDRALPVLAAALFTFSGNPLGAQDQPGLLQAGAKAPDFVSVDLAGREVRLSDYQGKVVVLDFWATWCGPCKASLPHVQAIAKAEKEHDVVVLAVCTSDSRAKFEEWVAKNQDLYPDIVFTCDPHDRSSDSFEQRASQRLYHVAGLPTKFVIGKDGKVALTMVGYEDGDRRLEAGLARAGVSIDPATAKAGEAQAEKQAKEDAARAAEAAANPPPPFWPQFGSIKAGEAMPDFTLIGPDGAELQSASLRGKPVIVAFAWAEIVPKQLLQQMQERYSAYGVQVLAAVVYTSRQDYQQWVAANGPNTTFATGVDPAGKLAGGADATQEERDAYDKKAVIHRFFTGNMTPGMPAFVFADADGKLVGAFNQGKWQDAIGNMLLHLGIKLKPEDMPERLARPEAFVPEAPRAPEPRVPPIQVGSMAPDFTMQDKDGQDVRLADYRGKIVVLDFWATWCGPCKASMPHTDEVADHYADQDVVVLASCTSDERKAFEGWVRQHQQDFPHLLFLHDAAGKSAARASHRLYGVSGIPQQFVIDRDGRIVAAVDGYMQGEVLLEGALAKAGVKVDAAILQQAAADQQKRDDRRSKAVPAVRMGDGVPAKKLR